MKIFTKEEIESHETVGVYPLYGTDSDVFNIATRINKTRQERDNEASRKNNKTI